MKEYISYFLRPGILNEIRQIKKRVYTKVGRLKSEYVYDQEPIPFADREKNPLKPIRPGRTWSKEDYGCSWFHFTGQIPTNAEGQHVALLVSLGAEGCLVDDEGSPVQGISNINGFIEALQPSVGKRYIEVSKNAVGGENIDIWVEGGNNKLLPGIFWSKAIFKQADIVTVRDDIKALYYDYLLLALQLNVTERGGDKYNSIQKALKNAFKAAKPWDAESVAKAREILIAERQNGEDNEYVIYSTGHAHLDLAWLWPIRETRRKAGRTFANALRNLERYQNYIFGASQPQQFEWLEKDYPKLFEEVKAAIDKGRIEVQGGMWVECDTNVTSGESLIRQNLYGKKYWKEKFNKDMTMCWLPDVFGFSGNLPQILKKCGMEYFLTIKLSWNEHNKFPKRTFIWEGIDDSEVLVHMPPEENYVSDGSPLSITKAVKNYPEKDVTKTLGMLYGIGDGGGGPGEGHLEMVIREDDTKGLPKVKLSPAIELFKELDKSRDKFDTFKGELYLEKHQGTYTSQAKNKYFNRKLENLLHNVEFLFTAAKEKGLEYPKAELEKIWKEVLLYQFHDIIPGSSIKRVHTESVARYEKMYEELIILQDKAIEALQGSKKPYSINPTSFKVKELVKKDDKVYLAEVEPYGSAPLVEYQDNDSVKFTNDTIESDLFVVRFGKNGEIVSLFDKKNDKDFAGEYLNKLVVYKDKKLHYNAWDIDINYTKQTPKEFKLIGHDSKVFNGIVVRENLYSYGKSSVTQKVILTAGKPIVEFSTIVDWQETHKMFRAESRPAVFADKVTCDIQMGNLQRSTKDETSIEKAQFEISAHKWIDVSRDGYGLSVLSDCKYGWRVKEGLISLNLLRSPMWPAKDADKGTHNIRYAFYPHSGDVYEAETARQGYIYNNPLILVDNEVELPSMASASAKNIVIETIKTAETGEGVVLRIYEDNGKATTCDISYNKPFTEVFETDMLENILNPISLKDMTFKPFEIKTILVK